MKKEDVDYRTRSVVVFRDQDMQPKFEVLCYGWTHSDLATVHSGGGGALIRRRLEARGVDTNKYQPNIFETAQLKDEWADRDHLGRKPEPSKKRRLSAFTGEWHDEIS